LMKAISEEEGFGFFLFSLQQKRKVR